MDMNTRNLYDNPYQGTYITRGEWNITNLVGYWMGVEGENALIPSPPNLVF
jgi:hypothetical protein